MSQNFLEIHDVTFAASKKNKVNNVTFNIEKARNRKIKLNTINTQGDRKSVV